MVLFADKHPTNMTDKEKEQEKKKEKEEKKKQKEKEKRFDPDPLTPGQRGHIAVLVHVLYGNPKVLYAPNDTEVDVVIQKVRLELSHSRVEWV